MTTRARAEQYRGASHRTPLWMTVPSQHVSDGLTSAGWEFVAASGYKSPKLQRPIVGVIYG